MTCAKVVLSTITHAAIVVSWLSALSLTRSVEYGGNAEAEFGNVALSNVSALRGVIVP